MGSSHEKKGRENRMKYRLPFKLSFIVYILAMFALPYITAKLWADVVAGFFVVAVCYQLVYVFYLSKKNNLTLGRVIAQYFLYLLLSAEIWAVLSRVDLAINGYTPTDVLGNRLGETIYGLNAITEDVFGLICVGVIVVIATIYQLLYLRGLKK